MNQRELNPIVKALKYDLEIKDIVINKLKREVKTHKQRLAELKAENERLEAWIRRASR